jgi:hypothetical protein
MSGLLFADPCAGSGGVLAMTGWNSSCCGATWTQAEPDGKHVISEWMRMLDSSGFGSYQESGINIAARRSGKVLHDYLP